MALFRYLLPATFLFFLLGLTTSTPASPTTARPLKNWPELFSKDSVAEFFTTIVATLTKKPKASQQPSSSPSKPSTSSASKPISEKPAGGDGHGGDGEYIDALYGSATNTFIVLHGLDDNAKRIATMFKPLRLLMPKTRLIFPQAGDEYVTYLKKIAASWFNIPGREGEKDSEPIVDKEGLLKSVQRIERIVKGEMARGIGKGKVIVGGVSQGGAVALTAYLRSKTRLAGAVGISTFLPLDDEYPDKLEEGGEGKKVLLIHGESDDVLNIESAEEAEKKLKSLGRGVELVRIEGGDHTLANASVRVGLKIADFIKSNT